MASGDTGSVPVFHSLGSLKKWESHNAGRAITAPRALKPADVILRIGCSSGALYFTVLLV